MHAACASSLWSEKDSNRVLEWLQYTDWAFCPGEVLSLASSTNHLACWRSRIQSMVHNGPARSLPEVMLVLLVGLYRVVATGAEWREVVGPSWHGTSCMTLGL